MMPIASIFPITDPTWIFFLVLCVILFAPILLNRLHIPHIVGMLLAGVLIGPHGLDLLQRDSSFEIFGNVGLLYIMFLAGVEIDLADFNKNKHKSLAFGLTTFLFPFVIGAHRFLEKYTLSKWQQYWKEQVANWYGMFLHESQYLEPVMPDIEAMLVSSQRNVTGEVTLELRPYSFQTMGVDSPNDLVKNKLGEYGETAKAWSSDDAKGFIKVSSTALRAYYLAHPDEER